MRVKDNKLNRIKTAIPVFAIVIGLILLPMLYADMYFLHLMVLILMWIMLGQAWNLLAGYAGQISFGHAAFFGVGAYTTALLFTIAGIPPWIAMVAGGFSAALLSIPIGFITFRLRGPYFSLSTFAFAEILRLIAVNWRSFTKGAVGILYPPLNVSETIPYYIILISALVTVFCIRKVLASKIGYYWAAIREDHDVAASLGINAALCKILALFISTFFTGIAGGFYSNYMRYIDPETVFSPIEVSLAVIVVVMVGGLGTLSGPTIGAVVIVLLSELLRDLLPFAHLLFYGVLICVVVLFMPQGVIERLRSLWKRYAAVFAK